MSRTSTKHETSGRLGNEQNAALACLLEAIAPKVGNVHRGADFDDLCFADFGVSAVLLGRAMDDVRNGVGAAVLQAVRDTQSYVATNTNLGIALLIAPLAASALPLRENINGVLSSLTESDAADVYEAIRTANPGGLGEADEMDVRKVEAPPSLLEAMKLAEQRDLVARQYANGFQDVFAAAAGIESHVAEGQSVENATVLAHLTLLATCGDSLIARKAGSEASDEVAARAARVLALRDEQPEAFWDAVGDLDFYLRSDGHRRNPGATADLIAAALFVLLKEGRLPRPLPTLSKRLG